MCNQQLKVLHKLVHLQIIVLCMYRLTDKICGTYIHRHDHTTQTDRQTQTRTHTDMNTHGYAHTHRHRHGYRYAHVRTLTQYSTRYQAS